MLEEIGRVIAACASHGAGASTAGEVSRRVTGPAGEVAAQKHRRVQALRLRRQEIEAAGTPVPQHVNRMLAQMDTISHSTLLASALPFKICRPSS